MYLFQILVPVNSENGKNSIERISAELKNKFGGVTSYSRAPAEGLWEKGPDETIKDSIVVIEVMAPTKDQEWWQSYRKELEHRLKQEEIVIRMITAEQI